MPSIRTLFALGNDLGFSLPSRLLLVLPVFGSNMFKRTGNVDWTKTQRLSRDDHRNHTIQGTAGRPSGDYGFAHC
jgi:hypothetical protein